MGCLPRILLLCPRSSNSLERVQLGVWLRLSSGTLVGETKSALVVAFQSAPAYGGGRSTLIVVTGDMPDPFISSGLGKDA